MQLDHHTIPILQEQYYDAAGIHEGLNDLLNSSSKKSVDEFCDDMIKIALRCGSHNIATIFISSIAYSTKVNLQLIRNLNGLFYKVCTKDGFHFVDNGAVSKCNLWKDGIHLLETGKVIITNNFISSINYFLENMIPPISQCGNKDKLSSDVTTRIRDSLNRSSEMSINDVFPHCITEIKNLRLRNVNKVIIGNLYINSLPKKFDQLREIVLKYVDVLVITETKLDDTFLTSQFLVTGFSVSYRLDQNRNEGGIMIFIRDDIASRVLTKHVFPDDIEGLFIELNFKKAKWLLFGTYHPPTQSDQYYFNNLDKALDLYSHYDKKLLAVDFNTEVSDILSIFLYQHDLENLVTDKTCFKNANNPITIDLFLTNNSLSFKNTATIFTGLSDCHKLVLTALKTTFSKNKPK